MLSEEECEQMWAELEPDIAHLIRESFRAQKLKDWAVMQKDDHERRVGQVLYPQRYRR